MPARGADVSCERVGGPVWGVHGGMQRRNMTQDSYQSAVQKGVFDHSKRGL